MTDSALEALRQKLRDRNLAARKSTHELELNSEQQRAVDLALAGKSFALTGPAGSGKTTTVREIIKALIASNKVSPVTSVSHKHFPPTGVPGIAICAYTNNAVDNVKKNLPKELIRNCLTIHKLLEYRPVDIVVESVGGEYKNSMVFEPNRHRDNPQPAEITTLIIEEASMVPIDLWNKLIDSFPSYTHSDLQIIMVGDIQQLPPVFGNSIYIHAMSRGIETVELTTIYRQALESPIISLAHRILSGNPIADSEWKDIAVTSPSGSIIRKKWPKEYISEVALTVVKRWLVSLIDSGSYNPDEDIILTPFNESFGQIELNKIVASYIAESKGHEVYEVFNGINKQYFRIGERVLVNKVEATITDITFNSSYIGKIPRKPSITMDYYGLDSVPESETLVTIDDSEIDNILEAMSDHTKDREFVSRQASHRITVVMSDTGIERTFNTSGDVSAIELGYAITVHRSQGREYSRVLLLLHSSQATMFYRELLYTAVTRAKRELIILSPNKAFIKGIKRQRYPGNNAAEKIEAFRKSEKLSPASNEDYIPRELERIL